MAALMLSALLAFSPLPGDDILLAKLLYTECRGVETRAEQEAVVWTVLNRLDDGRWGDTIREVITAPNQYAWEPGSPVWPELLAVARDVLAQRMAEDELQVMLPTADIEQRMEDLHQRVKRRLPVDVMSFWGNGKRNHFYRLVEGKREYVEVMAE